MSKHRTILQRIWFDLYLLPAHEALTVFVVVVKGKKMIKVTPVICEYASQQPVSADRL